MEPISANVWDRDATIFSSRSYPLGSAPSRFTLNLSHWSQLSPLSDIKLSHFPESMPVFLIPFYQIIQLSSWLGEASPKSKLGHKHEPRLCLENLSLGPLPEEKQDDGESDTYDLSGGGKTRQFEWHGVLCPWEVAIRCRAIWMRSQGSNWSNSRPIIGNQESPSSEMKKKKRRTVWAINTNFLTLRQCLFHLGSVLQSFFLGKQPILEYWGESIRWAAEPGEERGERCRWWPREAHVANARDQVLLRLFPFPLGQT